MRINAVILPIILLKFQVWTVCAQHVGTDGVLVSGPTQVVQSTAQLSTTALEEIICDDNTIWGVDGDNTIHRFLLDGAVATHQASVVTVPISTPSGTSLAIADNILNSSYSPTFYASNTDMLAYVYDGSQWQSMGWSGCPLYNAGGYGEYVYYNYNNLTSCIVRLTSSGFESVFSSDTLDFSTADIAVDADGVIYACMNRVGEPSNYNKPISRIVKISPQGDVLQVYPFDMEGISTYGCTLINGTFYIGCRASHAAYPNQLVPVTFSGDSAIMGNLIQMPDSIQLSDLASCEGSRVTNIVENQEDNIRCYPNPVTDQLTIDMGITLPVLSIEVYNNLGAHTQTHSLRNASKFTVPLQGNAGIYLVVIRAGGKVYTERVTKN